MDTNISTAKKYSNYTEIAANATIAANQSFVHSPFITTSIRHGKKPNPRTSKYQRILEAFSKKNGLNATANTTLQIGLANKTNAETQLTVKSSKEMALVLPLVLLAGFLTLVIILHKFDPYRTKRSNNKQTSKTEVEPAVEEIVMETNANPVELRRINWLINERRKEFLDNRRHCQSQCICKLPRCPHCMGYETKRIQWKGIVVSTTASHPRSGI